MTSIKTEDFAQTERLGELLAKKINGNRVFALFGEMGSGKTALTRGIVRGMGINADVTSPTFALINEYHGAGKTVYHFDMFRISSPDDLYSTGYYDYLDSGKTLVIEWSENIVSELPDDCVKIKIFKNQNPNDRIFEITGCEDLEITLD